MTTVDLLNQPGTPVDVSISPFTFANFQVTKDVWVDTSTHQVTYTLTGGTEPGVTKVIVTQRTDSKTGLVHSTIRLETLQVETGDDDLVSKDTIAVTIGISVPGAMYDTQDVLNFIGSAFSLWYKTLTSKVPNTAPVIDKLNIGALTGLYG